MVKYVVDCCTLMLEALVVDAVDDRILSVFFYPVLVFKVLRLSLKQG